MKYNPETKIYYGPKDAEHRLVPAPDITISTEMQYSNDTVIGYTYIINLTGVATALDLRNVDPNTDIDYSSFSYGIGEVTEHIHKLRKILAQNGNTLRVVDNTNTELLVARGGILRSFSIDESNNNWYSFANYTASIEFNTIQFIGSTWKPSYLQEDCNTPFLDDNTYTKNNAGILDISKYKIKTFSDSWSVTFDEQEAFEKIVLTETGSNLNIDNNSFNISYNISATGKHFFDGTADSAPKLLPAWENAKNFVQYRLHAQVTNLIDGILKNTGTACNPPDNLSDLHDPGDPNGLYKDVGDNKYLVFNEKITCECSESDGSFSATYSAIVKNNKVSQWTSQATKHKVSKSVNLARSSTQTTKTISIKGTIEGLLEGGIIRSSKPIELPSQGAILVYQNSSDSKYDNAKSLLDQIYSESDYNGGIGRSGKKDLKPWFKNVLGVTLEELTGSDCLLSNPTQDPRTDPPHPTSFNLTHDYNNGTITYNVEYNSTACDRRYKEISIQTSNPTKVVAILNVPNNNSCPVIQELGTYTAKKVNITIRGVDLSDTGRPSTINLLDEISCGSCDSEEYYPIELPSEAGVILTQKEYSRNPIDGSYTITLGYICGTEGCDI